MMRALLILFFSCNVILAYDLRIDLKQGVEVSPYVHGLTELSLVVFSEYPFLYEGTQEEYGPLIENYTRCGTVAILFDGDKIVGACTGIPLAEVFPKYRRSFEELGLDVMSYYYIGEMMMLKEYRHRGFGTALYERVEAVARRECYSMMTLCLIPDKPSDPKRPVEYFPAEVFWKKQGYVEQPCLTVEGFWKEHGQVEETSHPMVYWTKSLD